MWPDRAVALGQPLEADERTGPACLFKPAWKLARGADVANPEAVLFGANQERALARTSAV